MSVNNLPGVVKADTHYRTYTARTLRADFTARIIYTGAFLDTRTYMYFITVAPCYHTTTTKQQHQPGIERVQALADISRLAVCCHSNETRAPIANPPNNAQLESTIYTNPNLYIRVPAVVWEMRRGWTDRQTDRLA